MIRMSQARHLFGEAYSKQDSVPVQDVSRKCCSFGVIIDFDNSGQYPMRMVDLFQCSRCLLETDWRISFLHKKNDSLRVSVSFIVKLGIGIAMAVFPASNS
jgi:hypothetical protein